MARDARDDSTITGLAPPPRTAVTAAGDPELVMIAVADALGEPSARHQLRDLDEVWFSRGPRGSARRGVDGKRVLELRLPDRRMSSDHGRLVHTPGGWVLDDPQSKNGAIVDGAPVRRAVLGDDAVVELGHTFFVFRHAAAGPPTGQDGLPACGSIDLDEAALDPGVLATFDATLAQRFADLERIARTTVSVLLDGETGTGKELVARALHARSGRRGELVAVNCAALSPSLVEAELFGHRRGAFTGAIAERAGLVRSADGGTLFLDEVGEMPAAAQATLLRVLQEREVVPVGGDHPVKVDLRLCVATLRDLEAMVSRGEFRPDLYARLIGFSLRLPPLRARRVDLGVLIRRVLAAHGASDATLAPAALRALLAHPWPLNVRELDRVLATALALADKREIGLAHLPETMRAPRAIAAPPDDDEALRARLVELLGAHRGNVIAVGRAMGTRRTQVYRWLRRFALDPAAYR